MAALVLDIDRTLVHTTHEQYDWYDHFPLEGHDYHVHVRPGVLDLFLALRNVQHDVRVVVWTAGTPGQCTWRRAKLDGRPWIPVVRYCSS